MPKISRVGRVIVHFHLFGGSKDEAYPFFIFFMGGGGSAAFIANKDRSSLDMVFLGKSGIFCQVA